jgi:uncharacterized protein YndB with AHSA1/START domain
MESGKGAADAAVEKATGKSWRAWAEAIDAAGGRDWSHKEIVAFLKERGLSGWWQQQVAVGYEKAHGRRVLGQTADAGFQVGVTRTFEASPERVWAVLTSPEGLKVWLGEAPGVTVEAGRPYRTVDGVAGEFRVVKPTDRLRMTRNASGEAGQSTLQISLMASKAGKTSVTFHMEKLADADERETMRRRWTDVLERLRELVGGSVDLSTRQKRPV